jgi:hypothetical protein
MLADALLRSAAGATAFLRIVASETDSNMLELGLVATTYAEVPISPVVLRKLKPTWKEGDQPKWELLMSATGVELQVNALNLPAAQSLFMMTVCLTVSGQDYLIESVSSNEAFGNVYLYRMLLREARQQAV